MCGASGQHRNSVPWEVWRMHTASITSSVHPMRAAACDFLLASGEKQVQREDRVPGMKTGT